ncbi:MULTISPECIES: hypothetical protein [unclassified Massilia]|uniref:hypothetical protein n=1 Tax=unclassified Massilia TaxID=2609279 RepID=UPI00177DF879|nr:MULTISPECIES: hypothetical protein [unclassified Massilia]MBD8533015.1 hypothetical protein [Massilia sp. CFBP 13647]MBD8676332.1 hypothetical protein [Massilia sp. CFBP 13721]
MNSKFIWRVLCYASGNGNPIISGGKMRFSRWIIRTAAVFLMAFAKPGLTANESASLTYPNCPTQSFEEIRAQTKPTAVGRGEALIDRAVFWNRIEKIANTKEVFKFKTSKKNKVTGLTTVVEKEVTFHKSITDNEHRTVIEAVFDRWEATGGGHPKHLALLLGTAYRETCGIMASTVGEACGCRKTCSKDEFQASKYGRKDSCGRAYFGRGFVQLTGTSNYDSVGKRLSIPLQDYPNLAYEQPFAIMMLVDGVKGRWYAGKPLNTYLDDERSDWVRARESVNPGSANKAATGYLSCRFYDAIKPAYHKPAPAQDPALCMALKNL